MKTSTPVAYLDPSRVTGTRRTDTPLSRSVTGYGSKIPTGWLVQLDNRRWHRVYVIQYSNAGSAYLMTKGGRLFLGSYDPSHKEGK